MLKIGITGCMGSGKSTVSKIFMQLGIPLYDADSRAKQLMIESPSLVSKIKSIFGAEAYTEDGMLDRSLLSAKAFSDQQLLTKLNDAVHPAVYTDFNEWVIKQTSPYVMKEAALMYESASYKQLDKIIVVTAPEELRINRSMKRDNATRESVLKRMKNQWPENEKRKLAQFEIVNDEQQLVIPQIIKIHKELLLASYFISN
jgi:dephospho-CoA kinase